jgi:AmiR/NasT family two-component response regulator
VYQAPAGEFVTNADLAFATRDAARRLPQQLEDKAKVDQAAGVLSALLGWSPDDARRRLPEAAGRAGTPVAAVAEVLVTLTSV